MFNLELLMQDLKMTQSELATVLGVSQTAISKVKNGHMDIPEAWVDYLNEKYDVIITKYFYSVSELKEPPAQYESIMTDTLYLLKSVFNLTESNKILAESVYKAIDANVKLIDKVH
jgi:transcriptional regulator with XRE-family HTH domain